MHAYLPKIGGAQVQAHCLADALSKMGNNVTVFADEKLVEDCNHLGWEFPYNLVGARYPNERLLYLSTFIWVILLKREMSRIISDNKIDVVQLVMAWPWIPAASMILEKKVPVVVRVAGDDIQIDEEIGYGIRRDKRKDYLTRSGLTNVSKAIAISQTVTEEYIHVGVLKNDVVEIPPGVDYHAFSDCEIDVKAERAKRDIPIDRTIIISVGRNHPKKGFKDLVRSLEFLNQDEDKFLVIIVGKGSNELIREAESINQRNNFIPIDEVAELSRNSIDTFPSMELIKLYKVSDYFVSSSYLETYANVAVEAMAAGIPAIVTDAPGCRDTIVNGKDGLVVPTYSPENIAEAILRLENDPELRDTIVENGKRKANKQDWDNVARQYLEVYESLV